jgi:hypothetical protein
MQNNCRPVLHEFQDGFKYPNFFFSPSVLSKLDLLDCGVQCFNLTLHKWVGFDTGHFIKLEVRDHRVILVKAEDVNCCVDFEQHLQKLLQPSSPNIIHGLANKHKYMQAISRAPSEHRSP